MNFVTYIAAVRATEGVRAIFEVERRTDFYIDGEEVEHINLSVDLEIWSDAVGEGEATRELREIVVIDLTEESEEVLELEA